MDLLATRVLVPRFGHHKKIVASPPQRFAQFVSLMFSTTALAMTGGFGLAGVAEGVLAILVFFALMESCLGFCAGCFVFGYLMKLGIILEETCKRCAGIQGQTTLNTMPPRLQRLGSGGPNVPGEPCVFSVSTGTRWID